MARYDLTDYEWKVIAPLLPQKSRGVPRVDDRRVLSAILWVLRSGAPWRDLPEPDRCMGRSRGGLTTKVHALVNARGLPVRLMLTAGQTHDSQAAAELLAVLPANAVVVADKGYDADWIRDVIEAQETAPDIPAKSNRKQRFCFSRRLYRERNLIERFFGKLKQFRRIATRYEKLAANDLAMLKLASIRRWLRAYEATT